jgi:hypothetical protein
MSKLFFDDWLDLGKLEREIKKVARTYDEKTELWRIVDEIIHHKVIGCVLDHLPSVHHKEFVKKYLDTPHDEKLGDYLQDKIQVDVKVLVREVVALAVTEILNEILPRQKGKKRV